ncbi:type I-E CRISPR-associated protein Cse1/CasA [Kitasatospora phosalacinea]|uniref:Type I-E CRISPR-associated protein Cse1/CasA n=1 Tax=Kitasatospora phosalacinea TaxID=2065 RepID=A0A9W6UQU5_9ACTN|nr:type I-E CRISPR-associated protein Cse1/CasA [Kitasatospora phosalacinea]GLW56803.1 hypothetical protein Kpho01_48140 [Kitasatospora phosalacinea]
MPTRPSFSAADDPWIDVRTAHRYETVGLRELLLRAHEFDDLALPVPPAASALLRILVVICARTTGLDDPDLPASQWNALRREHLAAGRFDATAVHTYIDAHEWDAFHPHRPWMQDPLLAAQCPIPVSVNKLTYGRPAGNNLAWFSPHTDTDPKPLPVKEALWHLLIHHSYGAFGGCTPRTTPAGTAVRSTAGPLRGTASYHPLGRTLHETLLVGIPKFTGDEQNHADLCPWEEPKTPDPDAPPHPVTWPGRLLTGRSRHALLLVPDEDGTHVTDAYLTWATQHPRLPATDPYLAIHTNAKLPVERRRTPRLADISRAWWRDLEALVLAPDETAAIRRPEVFDTLNDLPAELRRALRVRVHGFDQDSSKVIDNGWYSATTPPVWTWAQDRDPRLAQRIADCCHAAEALAAALAKTANQAWKDATTPRAPDRPARPARPATTRSTWAHHALAAYWPLAETTFWRLLDDYHQSARAAFAGNAIHALHRAASTTALHHRQARRALHDATTALRRAGREPATDTTRPR